MSLFKKLFKNYCAWHNFVATGLKILMYFCVYTQVFALVRLALPALV
jgi:hypothetical protein